MPLVLLVLKQLLERLSSQLWRRRCVLQEFQLEVLPVLGQRAVLAQVVLVVELLLLRNQVFNDGEHLGLDFFPHPIETEVVLVDLVSDLRRSHLFVVKDVLLEELVVSVLVPAVEQSVSLYLVVPEALLLVVEV